MTSASVSPWRRLDGNFRLLFRCAPTATGTAAKPVSRTSAAVPEPERFETRPVRLSDFGRSWFLFESGNFKTRSQSDPGSEGRLPVGIPAMAPLILNLHLRGDSSRRRDLRFGEIANREPELAQSNVHLVVLQLRRRINGHDHRSAGRLPIAFGGFCRSWFGFLVLLHSLSHPLSRSHHFASTFTVFLLMRELLVVSATVRVCEPSVLKV